MEILHLAILGYLIYYGFDSSLNFSTVILKIITGGVGPPCFEIAGGKKSEHIFLIVRCNFIKARGIERGSPRNSGGFYHVIAGVLPRNSRGFTT